MAGGAARWRPRGETDGLSRDELRGELVSHLVGANRRTFDVVTLENAIETFGLGSTILSEPVPVDLVVNRGSSDL